MWDQFLDTMDRLPGVIWNAMLIGVAIAIGLIAKLMLKLLIKKPATPITDFSMTRTFFFRVGKPINYFLPLLVLNLLIPFMRMRTSYLPAVDKIVEILLLLAFSAVLMRIVKVFEDYVYHTYDIKKADNLRERKVRTQLQFIRSLVIGLIVTFTICAILLSFSSLRRIGAGLLTGVGIGGIIIGFAAQRSLANLLAGFQIAFTQPLRIDDVLVVEGEWGRVEEITLTYVVMMLWDQRRLILPITYFVEKPFQNWTRTNSDLLGTVFLYLDYKAPLDELRKELTRLLTDHKLWDKRVGILQVTNATENSMEVRLLVSANSSAKAFDLRCDIREGLIRFIKDHYPGCLPVTRAVINETIEKDVSPGKSVFLKDIENDVLAGKKTL